MLAIMVRLRKSWKQFLIIFLSFNSLRTFILIFTWQYRLIEVGTPKTFILELFLVGGNLLQFNCLFISVTCINSVLCFAILLLYWSLDPHRRVVIFLLFRLWQWLYWQCLLIILKISNGSLFLTFLWSLTFLTLLNNLTLFAFFTLRLCIQIILAKHPSEFYIWDLLVSVFVELSHYSR